MDKVVFINNHSVGAELPGLAGKENLHSLTHDHASNICRKVSYVPEEGIAMRG